MAGSPPFCSFLYFLHNKPNECYDTIADEIIHKLMYNYISQRFITDMYIYGIKILVVNGVNGVWPLLETG